MKTELLAWCQFPEPQGTAYTERDLQSVRHVYLGDAKKLRSDLAD